VDSVTQERLSSEIMVVMSVPRAEHVPPGEGYIKIWFRFTPRPGWLPYDTEGLWAEQVGVDTARVANVPFLQDGVAQEDLVRFRTDSNGVHWATERVEASGHCTVRILPVRTGPLGPSAAAVHQQFAAFGLDRHGLDRLGAGRRAIISVRRFVSSVGRCPASSSVPA
jgi:hypothetical protein